MSFISGKLEALKMRRKSAAFGITYLYSRDFHIPGRLKINGRRRELKFHDKDSRAFVYEFSEICIHDCYRLQQLKEKLPQVRSIVDIGANQGIFLVAARQKFADAAIYAYEPNPHIFGNLSFNAANLDASVYMEAATREDCAMELSFGESDLHTTARASLQGKTRGTAFRKIVELAGGQIDILKMDCEGGEWDLFEDTASWQHVRSLAMEYHLWARPGSTDRDIKDILDRLGFGIIHDDPLSEQFGLITAIKKAGH